MNQVEKEEYLNQVRESIESIEDEEEFKHTIDISNEDELTVSASLRDSLRENFDRYSIDIEVEVNVYNSSGIVQDIISDIEDILRCTIGFTGPIVPRKSKDNGPKQWRRKVIMPS